MNLTHIDIGREVSAEISSDTTSEAILTSIIDGIAHNHNFSGTSFYLKNLEIEEGHAAFTVYSDDYPISMCHVCWDSNVSDDAWIATETLVSNYNKMDPEGDYGLTDIRRPDTPWIASLLIMKFFKLLPEEEAHNLSVIERHLAWALIRKNTNAA